MQRAKLVAVGIAEIGEVEIAEAARADARRILDRRPAVREPGAVPGVGLFRGHPEPDGAAVGKGRQLAKTELEKLKFAELTAREAVQEAARMYVPSQSQILFSKT